MEIAIIAHDGKKAEMVQFLNEHKSILQQKEISLVSAGTTGKNVKKQVSKSLKCFPVH